MSSVPNSKNHRQDSFAFISQKDTIHRVVLSGKIANILMNKGVSVYYSYSSVLSLLSSTSVLPIAMDIFLPVPQVFLRKIFLFQVLIDLDCKRTVQLNQPQRFISLLGRNRSHSQIQDMKIRMFNSKMSGQFLTKRNSPRKTYSIIGFFS